VSKKGERNQVQQPSKLEKAYGGYLPSVEGQGRSDMAEASAQHDPDKRSEKTLKSAE
jgi:hypothetical protein